ncbi:hypothetical protein [Azohydromonas aeria]|uniref:hypothetical protein n=1 Tax=Azohydromonas aeria TaxID=2590212 RepID=UPI0012F81810|nr:hypothetical protein [Azohydromonas aeria]
MPRSRIVETAPPPSLTRFATAPLSVALRAERLLQASLSAQVDVVGTGTGNAAFRYVGPTAAGNGSGSTWANRAQWSTLTFQRGLTYYLMAGNYTARTYNTSGTAPITIRKATAEDHGEDASGGWTNSMATGVCAFTGTHEFASSFWTFDGVTGGGPGAWTSGHGFECTQTSPSAPVFRMSGGNNIFVRHVKLIGMNSAGTSGGSAGNDGFAVVNFSTGQGSSFTASHCWFFGIGRCPVWAPSTGAIGHTIEHSYVDRFNFGSSVHGEVASTYGSTGTSCVVTWRWNIITDVQSTGGLQWSATGSNKTAEFRVYGNVFYRPASRTWAPAANGCIGGWTGNPNGDRETWHNTKVYNNTFYNCTGSYVQPDVEMVIEVPSGNDWRNNAFFNSATQNWQHVNLHNYNHFIASGGTWGEANGTSATGGDPFVSASGLDFTPASNVIPPGIALAAPYNVDMFGNVRDPANWTRGAVQKV